MFLWLACQGELNSKDYTTSKHWTTDTCCDMCLALESIHHITLHCRNAQCVWHKLNFHHLASQSNSLIALTSKFMGNYIRNLANLLCHLSLSPMANHK